MPYVINWNPHGVEWIYSGTITGKEIIQSNEAIYGDPRFDDLRYQLVDFTRVVDFAVSSKEMRQMAHLDAAASRSNPEIRLAVIAPEKAGRELCQSYLDSSGNLNWRVRVFENRDAAEAWLGI